MGLRIGFGQMGDEFQKFVNPDLATKLAALSLTAGQGLDATDIPTHGAIENIPGTTAGSTDLYRNVGSTITSGYLVEGRWGIAASREDGIATFDLKSGWNTVKNASIISDVADYVRLDGFVHFDADYSAVTSGIANVLEVTGSKSGNFLGGAIKDVVSVGLLSNGSGWNNDFRIATGGGNDQVTLYSLDLTADGIAGDTTYTSGQWLQQQHNTTGQFTTTFVDLGIGDDEFINTSMAADKVWGGAGNDKIFTGDGNDFIDGGAGNDILEGGAGADVFAFTGVAGNDRISDFVSGTDKIDLSSYGITAGNVSTSQSGANTLVSVDSNKDGIVDFVITLTGAAAPAANDYIF